MERRVKHLEFVNENIVAWRMHSNSGEVFCPDSARAAELHTRAVVIDCSAVIEIEDSHLDRARDGGVTAVNHTVVHPEAGPTEAMRGIGAALRWIEGNRDRCLLVRSGDDIRRAKAEGLEGIIFGPQNSDFLGGDIGVLHVFAGAGVRIIQLTYQKQNFAGSGCGEPRDSGLTEFGRDLISEMESLGLVVDLSHCGQGTSQDAALAASGPVIFSHAHPSTMSPHPRSKDDDLIRTVADKGGVMGLTSFTPFAIPTTARHGVPDIWDFVRHVAYVVDLVGAEHVGFGLDIDETNTAEEWERARAMYPELYGRWSYNDRHIKALIEMDLEENVSRALVTAGFSDDEIEGILGKNFLRVFDSVWRK